MVGESKAPLQVAISISQLSIEDDTSNDTILVSDELNLEFESNTSPLHSDTYNTYRKEIWKELSTVLKEIVSTLEQDCMYNDLKVIKEYIIFVIVSNKEQLVNKILNFQKGTNISSHLPLCKKRKCRRFRK